MLYSDEIELVACKEIAQGRLVVIPELSGRPARLALTVQHAEGLAAYYLDGSARLGAIGRVTELIDLGPPVVRYDPITVVIREAKQAGGIYLTKAGPSLFLPGQRFHEQGQYIGLDGSMTDAPEFGDTMVIERWEVGIRRGDDFVILAQLSVPEATHGNS